MKRDNIATIRIGDHEFTVRYCADAIRDVDGTRCEAQIDHPRRTIWIDPTIMPHKLTRLVARAISRAWEECLLSERHHGPARENLSPRQRQRYSADFFACASKILDGKEAA